MSRRDYVAAAAIIHKYLTDHPESRIALRATAHGMADLFAAGNAAFKRDTFIKACGL